MKTAMRFLLICLSPLALSQHPSFNGNTSELAAGPQGEQYPARLSSSARVPGTSTRSHNMHSQGFEPWVKQVTGLPNTHVGAHLCAVDSNILWGLFETWVGTSQAYIRTTNGGATWLCDTLHAAPSSHNNMSIYASDANRAWVLLFNKVAQSGGGLFATTDGGVTWKEDPTVFKLAGGSPGIIYFFDVANGVCIGDPPADGFYEIYTTSDSGRSWSRVPRENIPAPFPGEMTISHEFTAAGSSLWFPLYHGNGRIFRTTDKGLTWSVLVYPNMQYGPYPTIEFQDEKVGLGSGDWGEVEKTTDGGVTWTTIPTSMRLAFQDLDYVPHTPGMYVASAAWCDSSLLQKYHYGTVYTLDAGAHWTIATASTAATPPATFSLPIMSFATPTSGWQGDNSQNIYKWTVPPGRTVGVYPDSLIFSMITAGRRSDTLSVDFVNHGRDAVTVSSITLSGTEFAVIRPPTLPTTVSSLGSVRVEVCFTPLTKGTHHDSLVFVSNAANVPRASVLLGVYATPYLILAPTAIDFGQKDVNMASLDTALIVTNLGGADDSISISVDAVNIVPDTAISVSPMGFILPAGGSQACTVHVRPRLLASGSYYYAFVQMNSQLSVVTPQLEGSISFNLIGTLGVREAEGLPTQFALRQNYPNPFNPSTTIKYELPRSSEVRLSVYDMLGREVAILVNERMNAGVHEVKFDGSGLASGVYLYRMWAGEFVATKRLLLLK